MTLLSPQKIKRPGLAVTFGMGSMFEYTESVFGVPMTKSIEVIGMTSEGVNHIPGLERPSDQKINEFAGMQALIKSCVDNAEDIKKTLHDMFISRTNPKTEEERKEMMNIDLMALRKWFLDDIRKFKINQKFIKYNSTSKLKEFSVPFHRFVTDRNIYTHGKLCLLSPNFEYVLEYIEADTKQPVSAFVTIDILQSYNTFYKEILRVIREYNLIRQNLME